MSEAGILSELLSSVKLVKELSKRVDELSKEVALLKKRVKSLEEKSSLELLAKVFKSSYNNEESRKDSLEEKLSKASDWTITHYKVQPPRRV